MFHQAILRNARGLVVAALTFIVPACAMQQPIHHPETSTSQAQELLKEPPAPGHVRVHFYLGKTFFTGALWSKIEKENMIPTTLIVANTRIGGVNKGDVLVFDLPEGDYELRWVEHMTNGDGVFSRPLRIALRGEKNIFLAAMLHMPGPLNSGGAWIEVQPSDRPQAIAGLRPVMPMPGLGQGLSVRIP